MDGKALEDIAPSVIIMDITEDAPNVSVTTEAKPGGGMYITGQVRQSITVKISIEIHDRSVSMRQDTLSRVFRWAHGGHYLTTSHRDGQRLYIDSAELPSVSALKWTETAEITLTAYQRPWWEESRVNIAQSAETQSGTITLVNRGDLDSPLDATITAAGAITSVSVSCGEQKIALTNINVAAGEKIRFWHDDNGIQSIEAAGESAMGNRNGQSDDEIMLKPGVNKIAFSADGNAVFAFRVRGRKY